MLLSPKYGKQSRLPSNNRAATLRDKPSWCPTRCCWCKIDLRTGCSVWHQPSQDGMQGDPDLIGLVYVLHVHGTWNIFIYIYRSQVLRTSQAELCNSNFANSIRVNDLRPQNQLQTGPDKNNNERIKKQITGWNLFTCFYVAENFIHVCSKLCLSLPLFLLEIIATKRKMFTPKSP